MSAPHLATKLFIPPPVKNLVIRPRLHDKLKDGLMAGCHVTLVSAPAGFGKTTLISTWVTGSGVAANSHPPSFAWLSLDDDDNDLVRFWSYVITALQKSEKRIGKRALTLLQAAAPVNEEAILSLLVNDLAERGNDLVLILDDYHLIHLPAVHRSLSFLIDHMPPQFHVFILTRQDPPLPLALLRSRGQLTEIRQSDLKFTIEEAGVYINDQMRLSLADGDIAALNGKTEGWAAGIQMAGISLIGREDSSQFVRTFSGSNRYILDYLTDEILERQSADIQTFLMETSILDRLSASLCDAVLDGSMNSRAILEQLEKSNLFLVPLDQERQWYRYHHLFQELLQLKLSQKSPAKAPILRERAAHWLEENGQLDEAASYLHLIKDDLELARLLDENALPQMKLGNVQFLRKSVRYLPAEVIRSRTWLCILMAWSYTSQAELAEAEPWLNRAEELIGLTRSKAQTVKMCGVIYSLRTEILHARGDIPGTIGMAQRALELLEVDNLPSRASVCYSLGRAYYATGNLEHACQIWSEFIRAYQHSGLYSMYAPIMSINCYSLTLQGKLRAALNQYQGAVEHMRSHDIERFFIAGNIFNGLSMIALQRNELEKAYELASEGLRQNQRWGNLNAIAVSLSYRVLIEIAQRNLDAAWADLKEVGRIEKMYTPYFDARSIFLLCRVRFYLAKEDLSSAAALLQESGLRSDKPVSFLEEQDQITLVRVLLSQTKLEEAETLLLRLAEAAQAGGRWGRLIEINNLLAIVLDKQGKNHQALQALETSLDLAEPEEYIRVFVDLREPMAELLEQAAQKGLHPGYARRLLDGMGVQPASGKDWIDIQKHNVDLVQPLSRREIEVIQLIAMGLTNKEIAQRLCISLRTVKYHTTSIYTKLDVDGRARAIIRAKEFGLL